MTIDKPIESRMQAIYRGRLEAIRNEAISLAGTAAKMAEALNQTLERGGTVHIQAQMAFLTGAYARMTKDWGVVEHLQSQSVSLRRPPQMK